MNCFIIYKPWRNESRQKCIFNGVSKICEVRIIEPIANEFKFRYFQFGSKRYAFKNGDDPAGMLVSVLADFNDKTVITLTYCFFSTRIYSREILSTGEYVYILKGLAQFA